MISVSSVIWVNINNFNYKHNGLATQQIVMFFIMFS